MTQPFLINDDRLRVLASTRQGRMSIAGYNYQAAYAVARLVSMTLRRAVLDIEDCPIRLRYDWAEDLDEAFEDGIVRFTQCKRITTIGQPSALAAVLVGFAPKWLWVAERERHLVRFRLVCSDSRFLQKGRLMDSTRDDVRKKFLTLLETKASKKGDLGLWMNDANLIGHDILFDALWSNLDCVYVPSEVVDVEPAGPRLAPEKDALRVLLENDRIDASGQANVLARLRRLLLDNLITFDPTNESLAPVIDVKPRLLEGADVHAALDVLRPTKYRRAPFQLIDRTFLSEERNKPREQFVARQPNWSDVVHGEDDSVKFIERDQTEMLEVAVRKTLLKRIAQEEGLPALFVLGAPGDGKTTLVRRVSARLVEEGELLIADTGVGLHDPPAEPEDYVQAIERIASYGRPVILLLDDPLYYQSPWVEVFRGLRRPGLKVGILAASPQFLFDEHRSQLRGCAVSTFQMAKTSQRERKLLASIYGRPIPQNREDEFLIAAMEAATGISFAEIIDRLWLTLSDGQDVSSARVLSDLPWPSRAFLFVCFFSRAYEACPEPLLEKLLEMTGGVTGSSDVKSELQRMKYYAGWHIFRLGSRAKIAYSDFYGTPVGASHVVIARHAWMQRPLPWKDLDEVIIEGSINVSKTVHDVAHLAMRLKLDFEQGGHYEPSSGFVRKLIQRWQEAPNVDTRDLCELIRVCMQGGRDFVRPLQRKLAERAKPGPLGWLAMLQLHFFKHRDLREPQFRQLIHSADFSIAPKRASQFGQWVITDKRLRRVFTSRLLEAFDGKLSWRLNGSLLTYLLTIAPREEVSSRIPQIKAWLEEHPDNGDARTKFNSLLPDLRTSIAQIREIALQTAKWLEEHDDDTSVRQQYLTLMRRVPEAFPNLQGATKQMGDWLDTRQEDSTSAVRQCYLSFLIQLPASFSAVREKAALQTAKWVETHRENTNVRKQLLSFLVDIQPIGRLRADMAIDTAKWLEEHDDDTTVREQFLTFALKLPSEFAALRKAAAKDGFRWLKRHPEDIYVRAKYLSFLSRIGYSRTGSAETFPIEEWQMLAADSATDTFLLVSNSAWERRYQILITSYTALHPRLVNSLQLRDTVTMRDVLNFSYAVAAEWAGRNRLPFNLSPPHI